MDQDARDSSVSEVASVYFRVLKGGGGGFKGAM